MKHVKMLGLLVAAAAVMAFTTSASADVATSPTGTPYTSAIKAHSTHTSLHPGEGTSFLTITCTTSEIEGTITGHGPGVKVSATLSKFSLMGCGNDTVTTLKTGSLSADAIGGGKATLYSTGAEIRFHTSEGPVCTIKTNTHDIGTLTAGTEATHSIGSQNLPLSGFLCPSIGVWTGDYIFKTPHTLAIDAS